MRQYLVKLLDVFWREPRMIAKYYLQRTAKPKSPKNIFMVDGKVGHGGMFDRLKGAISVYAISKVHKRDFRIYFDYPFELQKYLAPNVHNWLIDKDEVVYSYPHSRPLFLYGECYNPVRLFKKRRLEAHFYYGYDSLDKINVKYGTSYEWGALYRELFSPTPTLQAQIDKYKQEIGKHYIAIHTRFLNLLGDKVETDINPELPDSEKEALMTKISTEIKQIIKENGSPRVLMASDSMKFIQYMQKECPEVYVIPGTVKHVDTAGHTSEDENLKMFLDYYLIANASKVYNIVAEGMWPSAFPEYAAKIGETEFKRIINI